MNILYIKENSIKLFCLFFLSAVISCSDNGGMKSTMVSNESELNNAISSAEPGSVIVLSNGIWKDIQIRFKGKGTKQQPIILKAETAGSVFIEGQSSLNLGGEFLEVSGLYFRNGYTPKQSIIEFRLNKDTIANNSRLTNCVIEEYTQLDRDVTDHWIELWGRNNTIDHCYVSGKSNFGPTVRVFLKGNEHIKNHHQITNNHFGPRPRKGGPHGETLQIGSSNTSMTPSYVNVSNNLFEKCNGEVEIISSKSNFNQFKKNIFFECEGSLVLRHGNYANVESNIFIGNDNSKFIGGIRIINTGHWVTNNYFYKIKGNEFRSALAIMNGIPKSPLNRYNQVTDVVIAYNSFIDCKSPWQFSVGANMSKSDVLPKQEIRSARPVRTLFANNLVYVHGGDGALITNYDKVDGVNFYRNITNIDNKSKIQSDGIIKKEFELEKNTDWLYTPVVNELEVYQGFDFKNIENDLFGTNRAKSNAIGAVVLPLQKEEFVINKESYGPVWFSNEKPTVKPVTITVSNIDEMIKGIAKANNGDIIVLKSGTYKMDSSIEVSKIITIKSENIDARAKLLGSNEEPAFRMYPKGKLLLENIELQGNKAQAAFATLEKNMSKAYDLFIVDSEISNFNSVLEVSKGSFADTISISNSTIRDCANGIQLNKEKNDKGDYNSEFVYILDSKFINIDSNVLDYYRGGYDESTIGGNLKLHNTTFSNCGKLEKSNILLQTRGIVNVDFSNNTFKNNPTKFIAILWGEKGQKPGENSIINSGKIQIQQNLKLKLMY